MYPLDKLNKHRNRWKSAFYWVSCGGYANSTAWLFANEHFRRGIHSNLRTLKQIEERD